jgi:hypothetical protein
MLKHRHSLIALLVVVLAGFIFGVIHLFQLRFNAGDIYPAYSSFRTDPLGVKMFYESLERLPGLSVSRFFQSSSKLTGNKERVLFIVGVLPRAIDLMPSSDYSALRDFMFQGGRVVICLLPDNDFAAGFESATPTKSKKSPSQGKTNSDDIVIGSVSFLATNGLTLKTDRLLADNSGSLHSELAEAADDFTDLPRLISWHSGTYFNGLDGQWRTVYRRKNHPVIIERSFGRGSLVLSTDSYLVSNEALRKERHPELLVWFLGGCREILFDETHLGVEEQLGVAALMRRYHLEAGILGLLFLAGLFVWKNSASLVPAPPDDHTDSQGAYVMGKESSAGFASLLRRSVLPSEVVLTSFEEWKTACARDPRNAVRLPRIERIIEEEKARPPKSRRPLETYQAIRQILTQRNL